MRPLPRLAHTAALVPAAARSRSRARPWLACILACASALGAVGAQAATPEIKEATNTLRFAAQPVGSLVLANAQTRVGVQLERLTLLSGEGHTDKKVTSAVLAGALTLVGMRGGVSMNGIDTAQREPIEDHLNVDDAKRINEEAVAIVLDKLKAAGVTVAGPEVVATAPFYAGLEGETTVGQDTAHQEGGLFKKSYHFGFYTTPVAGLKYRKPGLFEAVGNDTLYPPARAAAQTGGALDLQIAFFNDKKVFGLFEFGARIWGQVQGRNTDVPLLQLSLGNKDDFTTPSGGKDTYAYWLAFKPSFEQIATALAAQVAKAMAPA